MLRGSSLIKLVLEMGKTYHGKPTLESFTISCGRFSPNEKKFNTEVWGITRLPGTFDIY